MITYDIHRDIVDTFRQLSQQVQKYVNIFCEDIAANIFRIRTVSLLTKTVEQGTHFDELFSGVGNTQNTYRRSWAERAKEVNTLEQFTPASAGQKQDIKR